MLLKCRSKPCWTEVYAQELLVIHAPRELSCIQPWSATDLEWASRAATFAEVRPLDQTLPGIDDRRIECRHIRRRQDPRQPGLVEILRPLQAFAHDDPE